MRVREGAGGISFTAFVSAAQRRWEATLTLEGWPDGFLYSLKSVDREER
ncbi:hypothetical protein [Tateyamaria sp.]